MTTRATALVSESEKLLTKMLEAVNGRRLVTVHERLDEPIPATAECVVAALDGSERRRRFEVFANQPVLESVPLIVVRAGHLPKWMEGNLAVTAFVPEKRAEADLVPAIVRALCSRMCERMRKQVRERMLPPPLSKALLRTAKCGLFKAG